MTYQPQTGGIGECWQGQGQGHEGNRQRLSQLVWLSTPYLPSKIQKSGHGHHACPHSSLQSFCVSECWGYGVARWALSQTRTDNLIYAPARIRMSGVVGALGWVGLVGLHCNGVWVNDLWSLRSICSDREGRRSVVEVVILPHHRVLNYCCS